MDAKDIRLKTDILIIGGGSAGLWAADRAKEIAPELDVLIVDKGPVDWGGLMSMSGGDFDVILPGENIDDWVEDITTTGSAIRNWWRRCFLSPTIA